jgi:acyl carrier protein
VLPARGAGPEGEDVSTTAGNRSSIEARVMAIVRARLDLNGAEIAHDASLLDDLGADSLDVVELVMALEDEFGVKLPDGDAERLRSIRDVVEYVSARLKALD